VIFLFQKYVSCGCCGCSVVNCRIKMSENIECVVEYEYSAEQPDELTLRYFKIL